MSIVFVCMSIGLSVDCFRFCPVLSVDCFRFRLGLSVDCFRFCLVLSVDCFRFLLVLSVDSFIATVLAKGLRNAAYREHDESHGVL